MAEQVVDEKSDDLDIVSTGKLYQGPWEKKYWSSSRGKDRHPYPVGYVAHRTYNGNTYKMAILEGLKGPEFAISSTDGESCSGQTPDIAWEGFQKKSCVRIKFWRGKRFSCKIDGAELFGFKNPHVARLLRGLKANASPIAEQSELTQSHEHHTQGTVYSSETCKDPDLQVKLVKSKTEGKEKRSKKRKEVHVKSVSGTQHKRERPQDLLSAKEGLKLDSSISSENLEKDKCLDVLETSNSIGSKDLISTEEGISLLKSQENLDVSFTSSKTADEKGNPPVQKGSQILDGVELYAPDTLDPALADEKRRPQVKKDSQMLDDVDLCAPDTLDPALDCCVNEKSNSEKRVTESQSKDDTVIGTGSDNSYRSDSDSVGQEITNSMMTLLLPRALPLLKTYSRKKKKNVYKNTDKLFTENTEFGKQNENVSGLEDSAAIAPDSFENHQCEGDNVCANIQPSEQVWDVGETMSKMKSNQDVDLVFEKSLQTGGNIIPSRKDPELVKDESTLNDDLQNVFELVGCYVHPTPISMVMLRAKGNEVFVCVLCGYLMEKDKTLFIYKTFIQGEKRGHPSFIGHTKIISPISKNTSGDQIMQFTPDGKSLVLLNNIKAPCCREGSVKCQFSACTPDCLEKNAVKIVQVKIGYVHVICKFKTTNNVCCILVCEPNYLLAAEENGRINLWTMNSTWSAATEHIHLPTSDCMPNHITQMKKIPNSPALVVGHTSFGEFCLWDLTRKILVSKFSAPGTSFLHFLPINLFRLPKGGCMEETTQLWSLQTDNHEDMSLVLLVSSHDLDNEHSYKDSGCWSLALLAKNKLILLNALDPSCTVAGASAGYGMIGTCDGSLYIWELSTGTKLGYLSHSTGATVSCLVADESDSGAFAVAVDGSQLQSFAPDTVKATTAGFIYSSLLSLHPQPLSPNPPFFGLLSPHGGSVTSNTFAGILGNAQAYYANMIGLLLENQAADSYTAGQL
ncbi:hypothetical protein L2E82_13694 [Cichorium intybus]|uniref:Uncharacterized protein n=1 Tax=Cichorium intybus TaxID=13427 RepID=A0ACB9EYJ6_CICIN|nr:hypothetical protein L2E82_13694 [Cichorium intybus]